MRKRAVWNHPLYVLLFLCLILFSVTGCSTNGNSPQGNDDDSSASGDDDDSQGDDDDSAEGGDDDDSGTSLDSCTDDTHEENDAVTEAAALALGSHGDLIACPGDDDWYSVTVESTTQLVIQVLFSQDNGDLDVTLQDEKGTLIANGSSISDNELISHGVTAGTYYFVVSQFWDTGVDKGSPYSIELGTGAVECESDSLEPNNTQAEAAGLATGTYTALQSCTDDDDWYAIDLEANQEVTLSLAFSQAEGDIDLRLQDSDGSVLAFSESSSDGESLNYTTAVATELYARIYLFAEHGLSPGVIYTLEISISTP